MSPRVVTVFGATGKQGSSVIRALLKEGGAFAPRAITRDAQSASSIALKDKGVEVVQADLTKQGDVEKAVQGSEAVFMVTIPFLPTFSETEQGKKIVDACKSTGVKFIVWTSLPNATKISGGEFTGITHFDQKAAVDEYLRASGIQHAILHTRFFLENIVDFHMVRPSAGNKDEADLLVARIGLSAQQPYTWVGRDLGPSVVALLKRYNEPDSGVLGETFDVCSGTANLPEMAQVLGKVLGKKVNPISPPSMGMPELNDMIDFAVKYGAHARGRPVQRLAEMGVQFGDIEQFFEANLEELKKAAVGKSG